MPTNELWDLETALESVDGYVDDLKELLKVWLQQTPELLQTMQTGIQSGDGQTVRRAAHTMRSSMDILGASRLSRITQDMQILTDEELTTRGAELLNELKQLAEALTPEIEAFIRSPTDTP